MSLQIMIAVALGLVVGTLTTGVIAHRSRASAPIWASFLSHVVIGFAIHGTQGLTGDARLYDLTALRYSSYWSHESVLPPDFAAGKEGWVLILAACYFVLGHAPLVGLIINAMACAFTTSLLMGATARLGRPDRARIAGWLTLLPQFLLWGSLLLRESLAWTLVAASLWASAGIVAKAGRVNIVVLVVSFLGMLWIRGSLATMLVMAFALGTILAIKRVPVVFVVALTALAAVGGPLLGRVQALSGAVSLESVNRSRAELTMAGSGFDTTAYSDPVSLLQSLPVGFIRALLGPFPWEWPSLPTLAVVDVSIWLFLLLLAWRGWKSGPRALIVCVIPLLCLLVVLGATNGNYGTMVRLRVQAAVLLVPMAAIGWPRRPQVELVGHHRASDSRTPNVAAQQPHVQVRADRSPGGTHGRAGRRDNPNPVGLAYRRTLLRNPRIPGS